MNTERSNRENLRYEIHSLRKEFYSLKMKITLDKEMTTFIRIKHSDQLWNVENALAKKVKLAKILYNTDFLDDENFADILDGRIMYHNTIKDMIELFKSVEIDDYYKQHKNREFC